MAVSLERGEEEGMGSVEGEVQSKEEELLLGEG